MSDRKGGFLRSWTECPQPPHQQFQDRPRMAGGPAVARPQIRDEQLFAAEHIERQETIVAIVTVKVRPFLPAMHPVIGGVEVEDQLGGRRRERGDELVGQNPVQCPGGGTVGATTAVRRHWSRRRQKSWPRCAAFLRLEIETVPGYKLGPSWRWVSYSFHPNRHWEETHVTTFLCEIFGLGA